MKRLLTSAALFLCCMATSFAQFSGSGNGTEEDPYLIFNATQLSQLSNFLNQEGVVFKLMKDLDLTEWINENNPRQGWIPIGVNSSPFMGIFNGNNHKITGFFINRSSTNYVGLFGYLSGATIKDLAVEGISVSGTSYVGGLAGYVTGSTITNTHVNLSGNGVLGISNVGGFIGLANNAITQTFSVTAVVKASGNYAGGIVGQTKDCTFKDGTFSGNTTNSAGYTGCFSGKVEDVALSNIQTTGNITGQDYTGGLVGRATNITLTNIKVTCDVIGQNYSSGILGYCNKGALNACTYIGTLIGNQYVGGVAGALETVASSFTSCFTKGIISATGDYVGGIIGMSRGSCIEEMEDCSHYGDIRGTSFVGGLLGAITGDEEAQPVLDTYYIKLDNNDEIRKTYNERIINGDNINKVINNCVVIGNIEGINNIGGLVGFAESSYGYKQIAQEVSYYHRGKKYLYRNDKLAQTVTSKYTTSLNGQYSKWINDELIFTYYDYNRNYVSLTLTNNSYSGNIIGSENIGGLVGLNSGGELISNLSHGSIQGVNNVGGIVGFVVGKEIDNSVPITTIKSNVTINNIISASESNVRRIIGNAKPNNSCKIGDMASKEGNRALVQTLVILRGVAKEVNDDSWNGTSNGPSALKLKANYVSWGWDFDNNWNILETESYPYKKYQAAPPVIESNLISQAIGISGKSLDGGRVYLYYKDYDVVATTCSGNNFTFATEPLQSGALVQIYADAEGMTPSYFTTATVGYPGSGTEADPYRIYTAADLQGASNRGYYKLMNDIDLTQWINENSPTEGWPAIGRNSGEITYIDGDNHKVTGLWLDTKEGFNGLFSNFSSGQIKNLTVEVAAGKKVKGGDYTGILIGRNANGRIVNCTVKGNVEGTNHTGGIAGLLEKSEIQGITFDGSVASCTDSVFVGGLAGQTIECIISACSIKSVISLNGSGGKAGGLIGESKDGSIKNSKTQTTLTATGDNYYTGGLVGYSETPISLCSSEGSVTASGGTVYAGGLVGYALGTIENSYSTAKTTGTDFSAGLVGYTYSTIDKCYASGDVYGYMYGGGIVGELDGPNARLTNSVACNNILSLSAQSSWGCRVIGGFKNGAPDPDESNLALSTMQISLNGVAQKKTDDLVEGRATSPDMLKAKSTYEQLSWDFSKSWDIEEGKSYPVLKKDASNTDIEPEPIITDDEIVTVAEISVASGETINFAINLSNKATNLTAFQFDLVLPTGITLKTDDKGNYMVAKTNRYEDDSQILNISKVESSTNIYRVVCFSLSKEKISGISGAILNAVLATDRNIVDGTFEGRITNIVFTKADGKQLILKDATFGIMISSIIAGDTNSDGEINVADIVEIVNYIMGKPSAKFVKAAADLNDDGEINVTDIVQVVNIIMSAGGAASRSLVDMAMTTANDWLMLTEDELRGLALMLKNEGGYVAAQFDLRLKDGQTLDEISLNSGRSGRHLLTYTETAENVYKVIVFSLDNSTFDGNDGELLNIRVSGSGSVNIDNILFVTSNGAEKKFASLNGITTGIEPNQTSNFNRQLYYDMQGRRVNGQLKKGIYIVNGKKQLVR